MFCCFVLQYAALYFTCHFAELFCGVCIVLCCHALRKVDLNSTVQCSIAQSVHHSALCCTSLTIIQHMFNSDKPIPRSILFSSPTSSSSLYSLLCTHFTVSFSPRPFFLSLFSFFFLHISFPIYCFSVWVGILINI